MIAQNCFLYCLLPTVVASAVGLQTDEIETKFLHANSILEFSHSLGQSVHIHDVCGMSGLPLIATELLHYGNGELLRRWWMLRTYHAGWDFPGIRRPPGVGVLNTFWAALRLAQSFDNESPLQEMLPDSVWAPDDNGEAPVLATGASFPEMSDQLSCTLCSIIPVGGNWIVRCGTVDHGPFMSKGIAVRLAFAEALAVCAKGQRSRVSIQDSAGAISAEHCLCADFQGVRGCT